MPSYTSMRTRDKKYSAHTESRRHFLVLFKDVLRAERSEYNASHRRLFEKSCLQSSPRLAKSIKSIAYFNRPLHIEEFMYPLGSSLYSRYY